MAVDRTSGGFGGKLRDARERRGVSLRQIANATKISIAALEALERNDISRLPGGIFSRAFVRSYAVEVGLDPDATIQDFIAQFPNDAVTAGHPAKEHVVDLVSVENDRRMAGAFLWLIGLSLPIAGGLLYFATAGRGVEPPAAATMPAPTADAAPAATSSGESIAPPPQPPLATPPASAPALAPPVVPSASDRLAVRLSVKRPCYVSATVDGEQKIDRLLQPGEQQTLEVRREMVVTAGDASAVTMTLNGAPARPLGRTGEVVTVRINPTNYKEYVQVSR
jgi:cytoskeletal protein RodZ